MGRKWSPVSAMPQSVASCREKQKEESWGGTVHVNVVFQEAQLGKERERAKRHYWLVGGYCFIFNNLIVLQ